ncbi:MAG TPA: ATP-binding protein [Pseudomonadales bacterium]|nr:ATP-binding protein [Pseudomonadales bacterium]
MKKIGARIAVWYALSATTTLAILFGIGYILLKNYIFHDLDLLNRAEFTQLSARLGTDPKALTPDIIDERIRETANYGSTLFYINIDYPQHGMVFYSNNLGGRPIPDVPHKRIYNASVTGIGELRVSEFLLPPFDITIGTPTRQMRQSLDAYVAVSVALVIAMLVASMAIGLGLSRLMLSPIRAIGATAKRIRSDNLAERITVNTEDDEIADLASLLNQMFDRLELSFQQTQQFAAEVSHELKTPLSLVQLNAEKMLADDNLQPDQEEAILVQLEELGRINQMIDELLFISRSEAGGVNLALVPQDPSGFMYSIEHDARALTEHEGKHLHCSHQGHGTVAMEEKWIRRLIFNLLANALNVSPPDGWIRIDSTLEAGHWRVSVQDEGPGLTQEQCDKAFERFVRFNVPSGEDRGSGLGLAICRSIVDLHGGRIYAGSHPNECGLRVTFELPLLVTPDTAPVT